MRVCSTIVASNITTVIYRPQHLRLGGPFQFHPHLSITTLLVWTRDELGHIRATVRLLLQSTGSIVHQSGAFISGTYTSSLATRRNHTETRQPVAGLLHGVRCVLQGGPSQARSISFTRRWQIFKVSTRSRKKNYHRNVHFALIFPVGEYVSL